MTLFILDVNRSYYSVGTEPWQWPPVNSLKLRVSFVGNRESCWTPWFQPFIPPLALSYRFFSFFLFPDFLTLQLCSFFFTPMFNFRLSWSFSSVSSYPPSCPSPFPSSRLLTLRHHPFINFWTPTRSHWSASTKVCFVCHVLQRRTAERSAQCLLSFPRARPLPDNGMVSHFSKK